MTTRSPSRSEPRWRRRVSRSSSAWVGCSWQPSPALTTLASIQVGDAVGRPGRGVTHDDGVDAHRLDRLHRVAEALALLHRRARDREGHHVARESLGRRLERDAGAGGVLVEQRHDDLAPQRRDLRDLALGHLAEVLGQVEHRLDARPVEVVDRQQVLHALLPTLGGRAADREPGLLVPTGPQSSMPSSAPSSISTSRTRTSSATLRRQVLADEVGPDRQLAVAPVDEHRELHRAGPTELGERVERGADRPPGEEHVVDEDDRPAR